MERWFTTPERIAWRDAAVQALRDAGVREQWVVVHVRILWGDSRIVQRTGNTLRYIDNPHFGCKAIDDLPKTVAMMFGKGV